MGLGSVCVVGGAGGDCADLIDSHDFVLRFAPSVWQDPKKLGVKCDALGMTLAQWNNDTKADRNAPVWLFLKRLTPMRIQLGDFRIYREWFTPECVHALNAPYPGGVRVWWHEEWIRRFREMNPTRNIDSPKKVHPSRGLMALWAIEELGADYVTVVGMDALRYGSSQNYYEANVGRVHESHHDMAVERKMVGMLDLDITWI